MLARSRAPLRFLVPVPLPAPLPIGVLAAAVALIGVVSLTGCKSKAEATTPEADSEFECKERRAAYIATGGFAGAEVGVVIDCAENGPRIETWRVLEGGDGASPTSLPGSPSQRKIDQHSLDPGQFNDKWSEIEATGWRNLGDCDKTQADEGEATFKIGVKDETHSVSLTCAGKELPFPYNRLIDVLDLLAGQYSE